MAPEANKQHQRSAVDTLWTRLAFILRGNSKQRAAHTTNWQSKLMCNWAAMHFRESAVSSAGGDHTPAPPSHHIVWFSTCCLQNLLCFTMWTHNKGRSRCCRELRNSEGLSWHTVLNEEGEKHTFAPFYRSSFQSSPSIFCGIEMKICTPDVQTNDECVSLCDDCTVLDFKPELCVIVIICYLKKEALEAPFSLDRSSLRLHKWPLVCWLFCCIRLMQDVEI